MNDEPAVGRIEVLVRPEVLYEQHGAYGTLEQCAGEQRTLRTATSPRTPANLVASIRTSPRTNETDTQRRHDLRAPDRFVVGALCGRADLPKAGDHRASQEGKALASQLLVFEERLDDDRGETRERVLTGADDAGGVDPRQHSLASKTLNRMRCALPRTLDTGLDEVTDLLGHVEDQLFLERGQTVLVGAEMERRQEAHIKHFPACELAYPRGSVPSLRSSTYGE
jgi:hypothetical protein